MYKYIFISIFYLAYINICDAKTTFLPDWMGSDITFNRFEIEGGKGDPNQDEKFCAESGLYHKADGCPSPKIFDEFCPFDDEWISECYCPSIFNQTCNSPYRGDIRHTDKRTGYANCDDKWIACCDTTCPQGTSVNNKDGCDGYEINACGDKCFYPYRAPLPDETNCKYGTEECSDNCGGTRLCCKSCTPGVDVDASTCTYGTKTCTDECGNSYTCCDTCTKGVDVDASTCENGTTTCTDECGDTYTCCNTCQPKASDTGCSFGSGTCDDGCGGTRTCCCDENDRNCACPGYVWCDPATKVGDGKTCTDGSKTYHERCLVKETCDDSKYDKKDGYCLATYPGWTYAGSGYYVVKDKCTTQTGKVVKYWGSCTGYSSSGYKDCAGNVAPCKGMKRCDYDQGVGEPCECANFKYFKECKNTCNEDTIYTNGKDTRNGYCWATTNNYYNNKNGYYYVKDKCVNVNSVTVFGYWKCTSDTKDCNGNLPPCSGKITCPGDTGTGLCECGDKKYFDKCTEVCNTDGKSFGSVYHSADKETSSYFSSGGKYKVSLKCTMNDNTKIYYYESCTASTKDGAGNNAPCKDMQTCSAEYIGIGKECTCGGKTYYEGCAFICNYEDTAESCKAQGKEFEQKCYGVNSSKVQKWYGECK